MRHAKRNTNIYASGPVPTANRVVFFPFSPQAINAAAAIYETKKRAELCVGVARQLVSALHESIPQIDQDIFVGEDLVNESALLEYGKAIAGDKNVDPKIAELAEKAIVLAGEIAEYKALLPLPSLGLLDGRYLEQMGFKLFRPVEETVLQLNKAYAARAAGSEAILPYLEFGILENGDDVTVGCFICSGPPDKATALAPVYNPLVKNAFAESVLFETINLGFWQARGLLDKQAQARTKIRSDVLWGWNGTVGFALPVGDDYDTFADYLSTSVDEYSSSDIHLYLSKDRSELKYKEYKFPITWAPSPGNDEEVTFTGPDGLIGRLNRPDGQIAFEFSMKIRPGLWDRVRVAPQRLTGPTRSLVMGSKAFRTDLLAAATKWTEQARLSPEWGAQLVERWLARSTSLSRAEESQYVARIEAARAELARVEAIEAIGGSSAEPGPARLAFEAIETRRKQEIEAKNKRDPKAATRYIAPISKDLSTPNDKDGDWTNPGLVYVVVPDKQVGGLGIPTDSTFWPQFIHQDSWVLSGIDVYAVKVGDKGELSIVKEQPHIAASILAGALQRVARAQTRRLALVNVLRRTNELPFEQMMTEIDRFPLENFVLGPDGATDENKRHRFLEAYLWYGDPAVQRSVAINRLGYRRKLDPSLGNVMTVKGMLDLNKHPATSLRLQRMIDSSADTVNPEDKARLDLLKQKSKVLTRMDDYTSENFRSLADLDTDNSIKEMERVESQTWDEVMKAERKTAESLPLVSEGTADAINALKGAVFTVYGWDEETSTYGPIWQKGLSRQQMRAIVLRAKTQNPKPVISAKTEEDEELIPVNMIELGRSMTKFLLNDELRYIAMNFKESEALNLPLGKVGVFKLQGRTIYIRNRGKTQVDDLLNETKSPARLARALGVGFDHAEETWIEARSVSDIAKLTDSKTIKTWILAGKWTAIYDVALSLSAFPDIDIASLAFNESAALLNWIAVQSGMAAQAEIWRSQEQEKEAKLPVPYVVVGALAVDRNVLSHSRVKWPRAEVPRGESKTGVYLTELRVNRASGSNVPRDNAFDVWVDPRKPQGLVPATITPTDVFTLAEYFVRAYWSRSDSSLKPMEGSPYSRKNLFDPEFVEQLSRFTYLKRALAKKKGNDELPSEQLAALAYAVTLSDMIAPSYRKSGQAAAITGRRAYQGMGGFIGQTRRIGQETTSPEMQYRVWGTEVRGSFSSVFMAAMDICKETGVCQVQGTRRERVSALLRDTVARPFELSEEEIETLRAGKRVEVSEARIKNLPNIFATTRGDYLEIEREGKKVYVARTTADAAPSAKWIAKFEQYGIEIPDPKDTAALAEALKELKARMVSDYYYQVHLGMLEEDAAKFKDPNTGALVGDEGFAPTYLRALRQGAPLELPTYDYDVDSEVSDDELIEREEAGEYEAENNPRRPRRARRQRRTRRVRSNPLSKDDFEQVEDYIKSNELKDTEVVFDRLRRASDPTKWRLTPSEVSNLLPQRGKRGAWKESDRLNYLTQADVVARAKPVSLSEWAASRDVTPASLLAELERQPMPFGAEQVRRLVLAQSELTLEDTVKALREQQKTQRVVKTASGVEMRTLQASSALTKPARVRRLTAWAPPFTKTNENIWQENTVIVLSPLGAERPRVMMFRKGAHLDADMMGDAPADITQLLGQALRATMYWIMGKPSSTKGNKSNRQKSKIYITRVGQPNAYLAWRPNQELTLENIDSNLSLATSANPPAGYRVALYEDRNNRRSADEIERYYAAVTEQLGAEFARRVRESGPEVEPDVESVKSASSTSETKSKSTFTAAPSFDVGEDEERLF